MTNNDLGERVSRMEGEFPHLATKTDIKELEIRLLANQQANQRWLFGLMVTILIAVLASNWLG